MRIALLKQLTFANKQFDFITNTRTVADLMQSLDHDGVKEFTEYLKDIFYGKAKRPESSESESKKRKRGADKNEKDSKENRAEFSRLWALGRMIELVKKANPQKDEKWFLSMLRFFFFHACFSIKEGHSAKGSAAMDVLREEKVCG